MRWRPRPARVGVVVLDFAFGERVNKLRETVPALMMSGDVEILRGDLSMLLFERTGAKVDYRFGDSVDTLVDDGSGVRVPTYARGRVVLVGDAASGGTLGGLACRASREEHPLPNARFGAARAPLGMARDGCGERARAPRLRACALSEEPHALHAPAERAVTPHAARNGHQLLRARSEIIGFPRSRTRSAICEGPGHDQNHPAFRSDAADCRLRWIEHACARSFHDDHNCGE